MNSTIKTLSYGILVVIIFTFVSALSTTIADAQIVQEWVARYDGPEHLKDVASAITTDSSGTVYVTGDSWGKETNSDIATIAYDSSGKELWVARYNGPGNGEDYTSSIATDAFGNVYITGLSWGSGSGYDYATIAYDSGGKELWVARYNGPRNGWDYGRVVDTDASGNIYVTGGSFGIGTVWDFATVAYDASGKELWVARYNGPENGDDGSRAMAIGASGTVYVTGDSQGSGTSYDYTTIAYDSSGKELWIARYNGPGNGWDFPNAITTDASGNVYVTGESRGNGSGYDIATIAYDSNGKELWVARYNGPANGDDYAFSIAIDSAGNIYVTGPSNGIVNGEDYTTIAYDSSGKELWVARYNGPGNGSDRPYAMARDVTDNIYVTGYSMGNGTSYDYATIAYDLSGRELWVARHNGPVNGTDVALAVAADASGNVYVTGAICVSETDCTDSYDYATIKYSYKRCTEVPQFHIDYFAPDNIWPPNHEKEEITVTGRITVNLGCTLLNASYTINDEYGAYTSSSTLAVNSDGYFWLTIPVEAWRNGNDMDGRYYTITMYAKDEAGEGVNGPLISIVPHDQRK